MVASDLDSPVARGNTSDVYRWGRNSIAKVLRPGIPDHWAAREARIMELVHAAGVPVPEVFDLTTVRGRPAIIMQWIEGASLWTQMLERPADIESLSLLLAKLQAEVHATPAPSGMPALHDRLDENIGLVGALSEAERADVRAALHQLRRGRALVHFDVHPNNVLLGPNGPVLIDWFDAAAGIPEAGMVRSSLLMRPSAGACHLPCADASIIAVVHDHYVTSIRRISDIHDELLMSWQVPVLAARLAEPLAQSVVQCTLQELRAIRASRQSLLAATVLPSRSEEEPLRS